jgi:ABC-type bacteriocin/lantibiotic exporter with double-glycine peptidase domain
VFYPLLLQYAIDRMIVPKSAAQLPAVAALMAAVVVLQGCP